ncbi:MAG: T9SS type A sorting domain-containing protein [Bacteroidia bacterium]|nr:T9SS type A sorting domain-containing protein [Bacteroidia bacterium]
MKTHIYFLLFALISIAPDINAQVFDKAVNAGGINLDAGVGITTDSYNNLYITGYFQDDADFGGIKLKSAGGDDIFIAKYSNELVPPWVRTAGSASVKTGFILEKGNSVATDKNNNVYVTGTFTGKTFFDNIRLISHGKEDVFIAKYSADGELIWVKQFGCTYHDLSESVTCDNENNVIFCGSYQNKLITDDYSCETEGMASYIAKLDNTGKIIWLSQITGKDFSTGKSIVTDTENNIYVTGYFSGNIYTDNEKHSSNGLNDIFIAKYDKNGKLIWFKQWGGIGNDEGAALTIIENTLYFTGIFSEKFQINNSTIDLEGTIDIILLKLDTDGNILRINTTGGQGGICRSTALTCNNNEVFLCGNYTENFLFASEKLTTSGGEDFFIACYDSILRQKWIHTAGDKFNDRAFAIICNKYDEIYCTGLFNKSISLGNQCLNSIGGEDIFIARLNSIINSENQGISVNNQVMSVDVHPNPAINKFSITISETKKIDYFEITDIKGKMINYKINHDINNNVYEFDLKGNSQGTYLVKGYLENRIVVTEKIVLQ